MLIVGAGGMATQIFTDLVKMNLQDIVFWSEAETKYQFIKEKFPVLKSDEEVAEYFNTTSRSFILCIGSSPHRRKIAEKFKALGGNIVSYISPYSEVSPYDTSIGTGTIILSHVIIEPGVHIGQECILNKTSNVGHGCLIKSFCELAPGVMLTGDVEVGENCFIGSGAIILPGVKIGSNSVIAAGSVVRKNIPENSLVSGEFAKVIKVNTNS